MALTRITLEFDQQMALPSSAGFTIYDDSGATYAISGIGYGEGGNLIEFDGTWTPDDASEELGDVVTVAYSSGSGDLAGFQGGVVPSFTVIASYLQVAVASALSQRMFYSFDIQRTLQAPLNIVAPEQNIERFFFATVPIPPIPVNAAYWVPGELLEWTDGDTLEWI